MKILKYDLLPESYGSNGRFMLKEGTVAELIIDTGMLQNSDFDKVIPKLNILNEMFLKGEYPRSGEWEPFKITQKEYEELILYLCSLSLSRPYRILESI